MNVAEPEILLFLSVYRVNLGEMEAKRWEI